MWIRRSLLALLQFLLLTHGAPSGFPSSGNGLWYSKPGVVWSREWLPVGNGYLAVTTPGGTTQETLQLNIESLWSGGPFADPSYNGGNKQPSEQGAMVLAMKDIRQRIFQSPTGDIDNVTVLTTDAGQYGSYAGAGYLISNINSTGPITNYGRYLDLDQAIARTVWTQEGVALQRTLFCSNPTRACTQHTSIAPSLLSPARSLPTLTYAFSSALEDGLPTPNVTCLNSNTLQVRGFVSISPPSMLYEFLAHVTAPGGTVRCTQLPVTSLSAPNATIEVTGAATEAWVTWVGDTNFDLNAGDATSQFSFRGPDPHNVLISLLAQPTTASFSGILAQHVNDYKAVVTTPFALNLGQSAQLDKPTDVLVDQYQIDATNNLAGNVYIEWLLFNYGRYLLASSARGVLPSNLQGKWANGISNAWSADYHANINIQMNYWAAAITNLDVSKPMFDYLLKNWAPRGSYTAQVLYNITRGWVVHNEMNIFGHSGMKAGGNSAQWADYTEAGVWMMMHAWDYFDHTNDVAWWKATGWPLLKGAAAFHLDNLVEDRHFNDSTLVVNPCNSPEQTPITFGCAHAQQTIWQLFNYVEKGFDASGDTDTKFLDEVRAVRAKLDKGLHIGSWGQLQEWKLDQDSPTDTHRHLSHLIGLFPGYAVASYDPALQGPVTVNGKQVTYTKQQLIDAARTSLIHRGNGTGPDADSGWEKAWRAAAYAQLGDAKTFYHILTYCIERNFAANLYSVYDPFNPTPIFQIDANLAYPAAVMNALLQAPDVPTSSTPLTITLLPALPAQWSKGSIRGARVRGAIIVDLAWSNGKPTSATFKVDAGATPRKVQIVYGGKVLTSFTSSPGLGKTITRF